MTLQSMLQPGKRAEAVSEKSWPIDKAMIPFFSVSAISTLYYECSILRCSIAIEQHPSV